MTDNQPRLARSLALGLFIWLLAVSVSVGFWMLTVVSTDCCGPVNYGYAKHYYNAQASNGAMSQEEAEARISETRRELTNWFVSTLWLPVLLSSLALFPIVRLLHRHPDSPSLIAMAAIGAGAFTILVVLAAIDISTNGLPA